MTTNSRCRFIEEYANFKKAWLKTSEADFRDVSEDIEHIDRTVRMTRRGLITLDECMQEIAKIGHECIWYQR